MLAKVSLALMGCGLFRNCRRGAVPAAGAAILGDLAHTQVLPRQARSRRAGILPRLTEGTDHD